MDRNSLYQSQALRDDLPNGGPIGSGAGSLSPLNLLRMLVRRWLLVVLMVAAGGLCSVVYLLYAKPLFKAQAEIEMSVRRPKVVNNDAVYEDSSWTRDTDMVFNTRFAKFRSPAMEKLASAEYLKRYPSNSTTGRSSRIGKYMLASYIREVEWRKDSRANIVTVASVSHDPEFSARLVNVLSHCAGVLMMQENQAVSDEAVKWLVVQAEEQRGALEKLETQLIAIRKDLQLDSLEQRKDALGQSMVSVAAERELLASTLGLRKTVHDFMTELKDSDPNLEMLPAGLPKEEELNNLILAWRTATEEFYSIASRYTELHPEYRMAVEKQNRARTQLDQFVELSIQSVKNEIDLLNKQLKQVDERIEAMKSESIELEQRLADSMQRLQGIESQRDAAHAAYQAMLRRMEEARLSADEEMAYTKVIRAATVPRIPVSPVKSKTLAFGLLFGGFLGVLLLVLIEVCLDRVAQVADLKALGVNVLGIIPSQKKMDVREELATIGLRDKFSHIAEIFAEIHALISSSKYVDRTQVMLVCSILPNEGKTICSCNLAISSALNGCRTLLIDGDLRRPRLVDVFAISEQHPSLLEWLSNHDNSLGHQELVSSNVIENLDVITSRPLKEINPAELLGRGRLKELINWARGHYDRVIIDSPPLGPVGDAQVIANLSDSVILVSRIGRVRKGGLRFALSRFRQTGVPVLGCIANDVRHSLAGMFDGGESYGYSYGRGGYKPYGGE